MITITRIFHFEMAHAINGYDGPCKHIHGHSYTLHVTVRSATKASNYISAPGFIMDFKELKKLVETAVINNLDHKLVLSLDYADNFFHFQTENARIWEAEPTAENILVYASNAIIEKLPPGIELVHLKLYETTNSYAEWINESVFGSR